MKTFFVVGLLSAMYVACPAASDPSTNTENKKIATDSIAMINFQTAIRPTLETKCSPCHFKGGKMYASMPFDTASTIVKHAAGISGRFKNTELFTILQSFIEQQSSGTKPSNP